MNPLPTMARPGWRIVYRVRDEVVGEFTSQGTIDDFPDFNSAFKRFMLRVVEGCQWPVDLAEGEHPERYMLVAEITWTPPAPPRAGCPDC
jgi:hypothetical protein